MDHPATPESLQLNDLTDLLNRRDSIRVVSDPEFLKDKIYLEFLIQRGEKELHFTWTLPKDYPLGRSRFVCEERKDTAHCLEDGTVCIVPAFCPDPLDQMQEDLQCLFNWFDEFVVEGKPELRYAYPGLPRLPMYMVFEEEGRRKTPLKKGEFGEFEYAKMYHAHEMFQGKMPTGIAVDIGGIDASWKEKYAHVQKHRGLWLYIGKEPKDYEGELVLNINQLNQIFPKKFEAEIEKYRKKAKDILSSIFPAHFPIMISYEIGEKENKEIHWEMLLFSHFNKETFQAMEKQLRETGYSFPPLKLDSARWGTTLNASYDRFFGRGKWSPQLCNSRIRIIGVGAIGGTLAEMLVRGGCRNLDVLDFDLIQPGNVCRSVYPFFSINQSKTQYLVQHLTQISPFAQVKFGSMLPIVPTGSPKFNSLAQDMNQFDFIFDCSANAKVTWMLDQMELSGELINLSVTDQAKEFLAVTGSKDILDKKESILQNLGSIAPPSHYEGTGCWSPTFQASIADLNAPLSLALSKIDHAIGQGKKPFTFVLQKTEGFELQNLDLEALLSTEPSNSYSKFP